MPGRQGRSLASLESFAKRYGNAHYHRVQSQCSFCFGRPRADRLVVCGTGHARWKASPATGKKCSFPRSNLVPTLAIRLSSFPRRCFRVKARRLLSTRTHLLPWNGPLTPRSSISGFRSLNENHLKDKQPCRLKFPVFDVPVLLRETGRKGAWYRGSEGLKVPQEQRPGGRLWLTDGSCVRPRPEHVNHVWSYDLVSSKTYDGRTVRMLNVIDDHS